MLLSILRYTGQPPTKKCAAPPVTCAEGGEPSVHTPGITTPAERINGQMPDMVRVQPTQQTRCELVGDLLLGGWTAEFARLHSATMLLSDPGQVPAPPHTSLSTLCLIDLAPEFACTCSCKAARTVFPTGRHAGPLHGRHQADRTQ